MTIILSKLITILFCIFLSICAFSQTTYPKGKYVSIDDLVKKEVLKEAFVVKARDEEDIKIHGGNDYDVFVFNEKHKEYELIKNVFAVSDGNTLFLNGKSVKNTKRFCKVIQEGSRFLVYVVSIQKGDYSSLGVMFGLIGVIASAAASKDNDINRYPFVLDLKNNRSEPLTKELIYKNLLQYPALLKQFESERNKNDVKIWLQYLNKMNM